MNRRNIVTAIALTLSYQALTCFYHYIDKFTSGVPFFILTLLIPVLFVVIVYRAIRGIAHLIKNRKHLTWMYCLPTLVYLIVPFLPLPDAELLESKVVLRGCYEGTQNQAYVLFRQNHGFEIHSTSIMSSEWQTGTWQRRGDTLWLNYDRNNFDFRLGRKALIKDKYFETLDESPKSKAYPYVRFYVGYCKGLN